MQCNSHQFNKICQALNHYDPTQHILKWEEKDSNIHLCLKSKPNWLYRIVRKITRFILFKKSNECEKVIDFAVKFFRTNQDLCTGHSREIQQLMNLKFYNPSLRKNLVDLIIEITKKEAVVSTKNTCDQLLQKTSLEAKTLLQNAKEQKENILVQTSLEAKTILQNAKKQEENILLRYTTLAQEGDEYKQQLIIEKEQKIQKLETNIEALEQKFHHLQKDFTQKVDTIIICKDGKAIFTYMALLEKVPFFTSYSRHNMRGKQEAILKKYQEEYPLLTHVFKTFKQHSVQLIRYFLDILENQKNIHSITNLNILLELYFLVESLGDSQLTEICFEKLKQQFKDFDYLKILCFEKAVYPDPFIQYAYQTVRTNFNSCSKQPEFCNVTPYHLIQILKSDDLDIENEDKLFEIVKNWASQYIERKGGDLRSTLHLSIEGETLSDQIRFEHLSAQLYKQTVSEGVLSHEKLKLSSVSRCCRPRIFEIHTINTRQMEITWRISFAKFKGLIDFFDFPPILAPSEFQFAQSNWKISLYNNDDTIYHLSFNLNKKYMGKVNITPKINEIALKPFSADFVSEHNMEYRLSFSLTKEEVEKIYNSQKSYIEINIQLKLTPMKRRRVVLNM